jgi:hypothetical protein
MFINKMNSGTNGIDFVLKLTKVRILLLLNRSTRIKSVQSFASGVDLNQVSTENGPPTIGPGTRGIIM